MHRGVRICYQKCNKCKHFYCRPDETSEDSRDSIILNTQERQTNERRLRLIRLIEIEQERLKYVRNTIYLQYFMFD